MQHEAIIHICLLCKSMIRLFQGIDELCPIIYSTTPLIRAPLIHEFANSLSKAWTPILLPSRSCLLGRQ
jgi:hypothetical protein